jgi:hypothetical protein
MDAYATGTRAKDALKWAARTYVVAALGSIATHYIMFRFIWEEAGGVEKKGITFFVFIVFVYQFAGRAK